MGIIDKIKLVFAVNTAFKDIKQEATKMNGLKAGWKTSEFWLTAAAQIGTLWAAVQGFVPPKYAAIVSTVGIAVYTIARTVAKAFSDVKAAQAPAPVTPA